MSTTRSPLRYRPLWLACAWALVGVVSWLSLMPNPPSLGLDPGNALDHLVAYLALSGSFGALYRGRGRAATSLALIALGGCLELLQGLGASRVPDVWDAVANALGVVAGSLIPHHVASRVPAALERAVLWAFP